MRASSTTARPDSHRTVAAFEQYVTAERAIPGCAVFFLESAVQLDEVRALAERDDVTFVPAGSLPKVDPRVVPFAGALHAPGDEMSFGGRHAFQLQDYLAGRFRFRDGLTVVRQGSAEGLAAFLRDADTARSTGIFAERLLDGALLLDSAASFTRAYPVPDSLVRVHVTADGEYRDGPDGLLLGRVGDGRADIEAVATENAGRGRAFARIVDPRVLEADLDDRPWIELYVSLVTASRRDRV
ncbi:hypothetical protein E0W80_03870 [Microbacterium sp. PI-1]|uniref:hypothetical protein n=1 Tax=Microbacterium sp. PI-1 TaxID=2545631 RepID=UPI00103EDE03|nr:hypothetical protein [Microbacterium sp. PI-1]TCJ28650.1 hypothetical protein E0W80_03870 [Microbacterium sp. PI-1]